MEKQKVEIIITGVAVVLFIVLFTSTLAKRTKKAVTETAENLPVSEVVPPEVTKPISAKEIEWGRDPFVKAPERKEKEGTIGLTLEGIIWDETNPQAIINNEIVTIGDKINGLEVVEIKKDEVTLTDGKTQHKLELWYKE